MNRQLSSGGALRAPPLLTLEGVRQGVARRATHNARRGASSAARCRPSRPPPHDECRHPLPSAAVRRPCHSPPYGATSAALATHRRTTPRLHDTACRTPHDAWRPPSPPRHPPRHPPPSPPPSPPASPSAPLAACRHLCATSPPAAVLLAARCPSRNLLLVARSPLCRPLLAAWHPLPQLFARSATSLPVPSPVAKQKNGNLSTKCTERRDGWHKKPRNALFPIAA